MLFADKIIRIVREQSNDYQVNHPAVSRFHSEICIDDNGAIIYVDHSSNGTMINGTIIPNAILEVLKLFILPEKSESASGLSAPIWFYGGVKTAMGFGRTVGYFFKLYANFSGRARCTEYWYMVLWNFIFWIILLIGIL